MTKKVRIENADTSDFIVVVQVWDKGADGQPDVMASEYELPNPADLLDDTAVYLTDTRYIVIKEKPRVG